MTHSATAEWVIRHCNPSHRPVGDHPFAKESVGYSAIFFSDTVHIYSNDTCVLVTLTAAMLLSSICHLQVPTHPAHDSRISDQNTYACYLSYMLCLFAPPADAHPSSKHTAAESRTSWPCRSPHKLQGFEDHYEHCTDIDRCGIVWEYVTMTCCFLGNSLCVRMTSMVLSLF